MGFFWAVYVGIKFALYVLQNYVQKYILEERIGLG